MNSNPDSTDTTTRERLDALTFDTYVDSGLNATATAQQLGCSASTVRARVRRHSLRLSAQRQATTH